MDETIWLKFTQHRDLQAELLSTGDAELIEVCPGPHFIFNYPFVGFPLGYFPSMTHC